MISSLRKFLPTIAVSALIIYATLFPHPVGADELPKIPHFDKVVHVGMFLCFGIALTVDLLRSGMKIKGKEIFFIAFCSIVFGGIIELAQEYMHIGRAGDYLDFLADIAGAIPAPFIGRFAYGLFTRSRV